MSIGRIEEKRMYGNCLHKGKLIGKYITRYATEETKKRKLFAYSGEGMPGAAGYAIRYVRKCTFCDNIYVPWNFSTDRTFTEHFAYLSIFGYRTILNNLYPPFGYIAIFVPQAKPLSPALFR